MGNKAFYLKTVCIPVSSRNKKNQQKIKNIFHRKTNGE